MGKCGGCGNYASGASRNSHCDACAFYNMVESRKKKRLAGRKESQPASEFFDWALKKATKYPQRRR